MKKFTLFFGMLVLLSFNLMAQTDTVYTNFEKIPCQIKEITPDAVKYVYVGEEVINSVYKNTVQKIVFKSGRIQTFAETTSFKTVKDANDFDNVSLTSVQSEVNGLFKLGDVSSKAKGTTVFASMEKVKERAYKKLKIEAAMMGANVVYLTQNITTGNQMGTQYQAGHQTETNLAGVAYSNRIPIFEDFKKLIGDRKWFQCKTIIKLSQRNADMSQDDVNASVQISDVYNDGKFTFINAKIEGVDFSSFRVIDFTDSDFTLVVKDGEKIYNYKIQL